jgi:hypothetical protein
MQPFSMAPVRVSDRRERRHREVRRELEEVGSGSGLAVTLSK